MASEGDYPLSKGLPKTKAERLVEELGLSKWYDPKRMRQRGGKFRPVKENPLIGMLLSLPESETAVSAEGFGGERVVMEEDDVFLDKEYFDRHSRRTSSGKKVDPHTSTSPNKKGSGSRCSVGGKKDITQESEEVRDNHSRSTKQRDQPSLVTEGLKIASNSVSSNHRQPSDTFPKAAKPSSSSKQKLPASSTSSSFLSKVVTAHTKRKAPIPPEFEQEPNSPAATIDDDDPFLVAEAPKPPSSKRRRLSPILEGGMSDDAEAQGIEIAVPKSTTQTKKKKAGKTITKSIPTPKRKRQATPPDEPLAQLDDDDEDDHIPLSIKRTQKGAKSNGSVVSIGALARAPHQAGPVKKGDDDEDVSEPIPVPGPEEFAVNDVDDENNLAASPPRTKAEVVKKPKKAASRVQDDGPVEVEKPKKPPKRSFKELDVTEDEHDENLVVALVSDDFIPPPDLEPPSKSTAKRGRGRPKKETTTTKPKSKPKAKSTTATATKKRRKKTNENDEEDEPEPDDGEVQKATKPVSKKLKQTTSKSDKPASKASKPPPRQKKPLPPLEPLPQSIINRPPANLFADGHYESDADPLDLLA